MLYYKYMVKKPSGDAGGAPAVRSESSTLTLIASMADTTWRMFVPTLPLIMLGNWLDGKFATKPWLLLAGAAVGGVIAALLIRAQLRRKA